MTSFHSKKQFSVFKESLLPQRASSDVFASKADLTSTIGRGRRSFNQSANVRNRQGRLVNFDNIPAGTSGTLYPGNTFASQGVTFASGSIPNNIQGEIGSNSQPSKGHLRTS